MSSFIKNLKANNTNKILFAKLVHSLLLISDFITGLLHIIRKSSFNLKDKDRKYIGRRPFKEKDNALSKTMRKVLKESPRTIIERQRENNGTRRFSKSKSK